MKTLKKKISKIIIASLAEYTPPEVKFSQINYDVANAIIAINKI